MYHLHERINFKNLTTARQQSNEDMGNNKMVTLYKSYDSLMIFNNTAGSIFHSDQYFFSLSDTKRYFLKLWDRAGIL